MRNLSILFLALILLSSHDMFLKLEDYFLPPNASVRVDLFNGTFERSDNIITRDRMLDVSLVANGNHQLVDSSQWRDEGETTVLDFSTGASGTYLVGVSTRARSIEMAAANFNNYLEHDGVIDMLEQRRSNGDLDKAAVEQYSKHVKTIFQVGEERSNDYRTELGYPIEFIPLKNPYELRPGDELPVRLLRDGAPLADQLVYVGSEGGAHEEAHHHHDGEADHDHQSGLTQYRTNEKGVITVRLNNDGTWYLRTIHLMETEAPGLTHESNWATLTFAVPHGHSHGPDADHHHHGDETTAGVPGYAYWIVSTIVVLLLFLWFNRKQA